VAATGSSGAVLGDPGTGGRGSLSAGALEASNVDVGESMVSLIQHQPPFPLAPRSSPRRTTCSRT
jgi:flagellar hook protein FlgE